MTRPIQDWATLTVGETFGPFQYGLSAERVSAYREVTGDHAVEIVAGQHVAPPTILTFPMLLMVEDKYKPRPGGIHARQTFELHFPLRVDAMLTVSGVLTEMSLKRGRKYFTVASTVVDELGVVVAHGVTTGLYPDVDIAEETSK